MADQTVEIENVGGNDGVASEVTLQRLLRSMDSLAKAQGADARKARDAAERYHKEVKHGIDTFEDVNQSGSGLSDSFENLAGSSNRLGKGFLGLAVSGLTTLGASVVNLAEELAFGGTQLADFTRHFPVIGEFLTPFAEILDDSVDGFRRLSSSGASFNNSIIEMRYAAATAELSLNEFQDFVSANSEALRLLSGTVTGGVQRFTQINRELKASEGLFSGLKNMGFTVEEINEGIANYTVLQSRLGLLQGQSNAQLAQGSANYLKQLDLLAKITGKQRDEIANSLEQNAADAGFRAIAKSLEQQFGPDSPQLANFNASMGLIDSIGGSTAIALKDLADGIPQTEEAIALVNAAGPQIMTAMRQVAQGADLSVLTDALENAAVQMDGFAGTGTDAAAFIESIRSFNPALASILDEQYKLREIGSADVEEAARQQAERDKITGTLTEFDDAVRAIRASIARAFLDSGIFESVASAFTGIAGLLTSEPFKTKLKEGIDAVAQGIRSFIEDIRTFDLKTALFGGSNTIIQPGMGEVEIETEGLLGPIFGEGGALSTAMQGVSETIGSAFYDMITSDTVKDGAILGLGALFGAVVVKEAMVAGIRRLFGGGGGGATGKAAGGAGRAAGAGIAGLGRGTGAAIGGIGNGLAAAGAKSPAIIAGGVAIGAAIASIGAGIAGATWLMGEALPNFAEGMESFETLDGEALRDAASGMRAMGGAIAAFGAGTAVGGVGSVIGSIGEALGGLFGGDSPIDRLIDFGNAGINTDGVAANAAAMIDMADALKAVGSLDSLDTSNISSYNDAIEELVETLGELNDVLSETNSRGRGRNSLNASDVLSQIGGSTAGSNQQLAQLNNTMMQVLQVLQEQYEVQEATARGTRRLQGNLVQGGIG